MGIEFTAQIIVGEDVTNMVARPVAKRLELLCRLAAGLGMRIDIEPAKGSDATDAAGVGSCRDIEATGD